MRKQIIPESEIDTIKNLLKIKTRKEVSKIYNISISAIDRYIKKYNIHAEGRSRLNESKLKFDINYFDEIDEQKAYWLGFIAADGCLKNNKVTLVSKDKEMIEKFKSDLCSEHKLSTVISFDKRTKKEYTSYRISITNNFFTKKLENYINNDKSNNFLLPKIDKKYYSFFIAGMFDGDGSISYYGKNKNLIRCNLISTKECLLQIQSLLEEMSINKTELYQYKKSKNLWKMHLYSGAYDFLNYIYAEKFSEIYLSRKFIKFKNYEKKDSIL
jgi:hypothetical protein